MVTVTEAKRILSHVERLPVQRELSLLSALEHVLAEDVHAPLDLPQFPQSGVDGYAFLYSDLLKGKGLKIGIEVEAGSHGHQTLSPNQAARVFTGAPVPLPADTVVMQEKVEKENGFIYVRDKELSKGNALRLVGSEIKKGELALPKGSVLHAPAIGFLASLGLLSVKVYGSPKVTIIVTGNELVQPGEALRNGQVYESNSFSLRAALSTLNVSDIRVQHVLDSREQLIFVLGEALQTSDLVLLTGGVSVGDYDFVVEACRHCSVRTLFHRIRQKPGKPLFYGKKGHVEIFGLPGNPASVLTCFYEYVLPIVLQLSGKEGALRRVFLPLRQSFVKGGDLAFFLKGKIHSGSVELLPAQESYRLSSFAGADCLVFLPEGKSEFKDGELVEVHLLPYYSIPNDQSEEI
ncbi:gephyrin-like molybdotransferase Glp [Olivibacter sitiensis]|uniref:molybdopterin molybdotransferase MoeA n=1 Tax=Olivibacter sitiensis TaxID=376470 RepID=UPI00041FAC05|nr:gephyrin-like molybdotransferase Glp [Olivibacter sitiensis]